MRYSRASRSTALKSHILRQINEAQRVLNSAESQNTRAKIASVNVFRSSRQAEARNIPPQRWELSMDVDNPAIIHRKKLRKPPVPKLSPEKLLDILQHNPNLTTRQLGKLTDADHSSIVKCFQRYGIKREHMEGYKTNRADLLSGIQDKMLSSITDDDINSATLLQRVTAAAVLYDKERLERGLSTSNAAVVYASAVEDAFKRPVDKQGHPQDMVLAPVTGDEIVPTTV